MRLRVAGLDLSLRSQEGDPLSIKEGIDLYQCAVASPFVVFESGEVSSVADLLLFSVASETATAGPQARDG